MKKIIRLTESDLIRLVKRVINEQTTPDEYVYDDKKSRSENQYLESLKFIEIRDKKAAEERKKFTGVGKSVANNLVKALSPMSHGKLIDDDSAALKAIQGLKTKTDFDELAYELETTHKKYFCDYLKSEMSDYQIEPKEYMMIMNHVKKIGGPDCVADNKSQESQTVLGRFKTDFSFKKPTDHKAAGYKSN